MAIFVDTNVLVYARDATDGDKHAAAMAWLDELWRHRAGRLSFQVLHEFYVTVTQKLSHPMDVSAARADVLALHAWRPVPLDAGVLDGCWDVVDAHGLSFWDALIVSAARVARCDRLLTEDLQHDQVLGGVHVVNPFRAEPVAYR